MNILSGMIDPDGLLPIFGPNGQDSCRIKEVINAPIDIVDGRSAQNRMISFHWKSADVDDGDMWVPTMVHHIVYATETWVSSLQSSSRSERRSASALSHRSTSGRVTRPIKRAEAEQNKVKKVLFGKGAKHCCWARCVPSVSYAVRSAVFGFSF